jgi:hypothetical protein
VVSILCSHSYGDCQDDCYHAQDERSGRERKKTVNAEHKEKDDGTDATYHLFSD